MDFEFQFQYGSIDSIMAFDYKEVSIIFQFQYGSIDREILSGDYNPIPINFNSSMVRLIGNSLYKYRYCHVYFNSSMVRLIAKKAGGGQLTTIFQFQYGSIDREAQIAEKGYIEISIPVWFD